MAKYQIFYKFTGEIEVEADNEEEALRIAEDNAYLELKFNGEYEVEDINEFED